MTRARHPAAILVLSTLVWMCSAAPGDAALRLCNRTSYILYASTGSETVKAIATRGWLRIVPGACEVAVAGALSAPQYFVYARTSQAHSGSAHAWGGHTKLCTKETDYALENPLGTQNCPSGDAFHMPFATLDTGGQENWTTTFTQSPPLNSANAARRAGIARLLRDIGYKIRQGIGPALENFRLQMKMAPDAGLADLFDALETEAMKIASPAGYSICNDTDAPIWAALGMKRAGAWVARGWWKVMPGACARAIATKLSDEAIYLLVERKDGRRLVAGKTKFCITNITFDIEGRTNCAARGLNTAGFAVTDTKNRGGFTAHVSEDGLLLPLPRPGYASSPK